MYTQINGYANVLEQGELYEEIKNYEETNNLPPELKVNSIITINIASVDVSKG